MARSPASSRLSPRPDMSCMLRKTFITAPSETRSSSPIPGPDDARISRSLSSEIAMLPRMGE